LWIPYLLDKSSSFPNNFPNIFPHIFWQKKPSDNVRVMAAELLGDSAAVEKWFRMACQRWAQPKTELEVFNQQNWIPRHGDLQVYC